MMNLSVHKPFDLHDLATAARPFARRLLPGRVESADPIRVDVHVRAYGDALPAVRVQTGQMPVGTLFDCYL